MGIDWSRFDAEQFRMGLNVELEHGLIDPSTDVIGNEPILTGKIALAPFNEFADYYTRLKKDGTGSQRWKKPELIQTWLYPLAELHPSFVIGGCSLAA